ncbi:MAG: hypothetical protein J7J70_10880, partial [Deltaproteobacteria bacterium]|nr:hypothetical protein [Candidatus Tharpellaceae bacterium]
MKKIAFILVLLLVGLYPNLSYSTMENYCASPPFVARAVQPNILIVMDVSGSMQFPAYGSCDFSGYDEKVAQCGNHTINYDPLKTYYGYFKTDKYYQYSSNKFIENDSCSYTDKIGGSNCISGNLLNWATMTRIDVLRKVLIGGRSVSSQENSHTLLGEGGNWVFQDSNLHCEFSISDGSPNLDHKISIQDYNGTCAVGTLSNANIQVDVPERERRGVIQNIADKDYDGNWDDGAPRFGLMIFASDRIGCIKSGIEDSNMSSFLNALQKEAPYDGTPTGEALINGLYYYEQQDSSTYCSNTAYIKGPGSSKDPWEHWCQKSFMLLISDGEWNGNIDPVKSAREGRLGIHENRSHDLRSDLISSQVVTTYTVYAFSDTAGGKNSLQQTAIYGGFDDLDNNDWPYSYTSYPDNSKNVSLPNSSCDPSGTYESACREWDKNGDGVPDNYYAAQNGQELENALNNAITDILRRVSSGTAASILASSEKSGANIL